MRIRTSVLAAGLVVMGLLTVLGCSSPGSNFSNLNPFQKNEQWEPDVTEKKAKDWRSDAGSIGRGNRRSESEDPLDKLLWSDQAREINRNVGFN